MRRFLEAHLAEAWVLARGPKSDQREYPSANAMEWSETDCATWPVRRDAEDAWYEAVMTVNQPFPPLFTCKLAAHYKFVAFVVH